MRSIVAVAGMVAVVLLPGCLCKEKVGMVGVDACWRVIGPEYVLYVNRDAGLAEDIKADRLKTAEALSQVIAEAMKAQ